MSPERALRIAGRARALAARGLTDRAAVLTTPLLSRLRMHGGFIQGPAGATAHGQLREGAR